MESKKYNIITINIIMSKRQAYRKPPQEDVACCPCIKLKVNDIDGIEKEAQERISYDNKNIDPERTELNLFAYGLDAKKKPIFKGEKYETSLKERILSLIERAGARIRTDNDKTLEGKVKKKKHSQESVLAIGIVFQLSHELAMRLLKEDNLLDVDGRLKKDVKLTEEHKIYKYFRDTYLFAYNKWGKRIVGAYVHFDEYTPHMHLFVVPLLTKMRKYAKKEVVDEHGNPKKRVSLCAKTLFSRSKIKQLWKDYASAMDKYGASAAKGLGKKGDYDEKASMEAVTERKTEMEENIEEKSKLLEKMNSVIAPFLEFYDNIIADLQMIIDKNYGEGKAYVVDYEIEEDKQNVTDPYGRPSEYIFRKYLIHLLTNQQKHTLVVEQNDYYKSLNDNVKKDISKLFLGHVANAQIAKQAHIVKTRVNKYSPGVNSFHV